MTTTIEMSQPKIENQNGSMPAKVTQKSGKGTTDRLISEMATFFTVKPGQEEKLREARVEAERMVLATRSALAADGGLLTPGERIEIERLIAETVRIAEGNDAHAVEAAVKALAEGTEAFAAARMNQGIRQALAGKRLEEV